MSANPLGLAALFLAAAPSHSVGNTIKLKQTEKRGGGKKKKGCMITPCEERRGAHGCHASALPRHFVLASACPLRAGRCGVRGGRGGNVAPHLLPWGLPHSGTALGASLPLCPCSEDSDVLGPCGACQGGTWSQGRCVGPSPASRLGRTLLCVTNDLASAFTLLQALLGQGEHELISPVPLPQLALKKGAIMTENI